jgi:ligand-binding sensor domain-containing protein
MRRLNILTLCTSLILFEFASNKIIAQVPVGGWSSHISYNHIISVTGSPDDIYAASKRGIQIYKARKNHYQTLTTVDGLSEASISEIFYSPQNDMLCVGYTSGNFDIVENREVTNFPEILEQSVYSEKSINDIVEHDTQLLLATDFGVLEFNGSTKKFGEIYSFEQGQNIKVYDLAISGSHIYAASHRGVYFASHDAILTQPSSWSRMEFLPEFESPFNCIAYFDDKVIVNYFNSLGNDKVYSVENNASAQLITDSEENVNDLYSASDNLYLATNNSVEIYNRQLSVVETLEQIPSGSPAPLSLYVNKSGLWVGDASAGLLNRSPNGQVSKFQKNGPGSNDMFRARSSNGLVYFARGGYDGNYEKQNLPAELSLFKNRRWNNFHYDNIEDLTEVVIDPGNQTHIFVGSWGDGLVEFDEQKIVKHYNSSNSALEQGSSGDIRVRGLLFDKDKNLWMINHGTRHPLVVRTSGGEWVKHEYDALENARIGDIILADNGFIWGYLPQKRSVFVIDDNDTPAETGDDIVKVERPVDRNGNVYDYKNDDIFAIAKDLEGYIWLATEGGVLVETQPSGYFQNKSFQPSRLKITANGNSNYLLRDNTVTDIIVDPGNRKWFATKRAGAFLFSEDGDKMLHHFSENNSPMLSDQVISMALEEEAGEVFFITSNGVISYRGEASKSKGDFSEAYVFPNPVKPDYNGPITITGLIDDVNVKITDISGNLVYETVSEGGQAIWHGKDLNGHKVSSGVYLVFITNEDGSKTHVEKILFIK